MLGLLGKYTVHIGDMYAVHLQHISTHSITTHTHVYASSHKR